MSEYCYQCTNCGEFEEFCKCKTGFNDPMRGLKDMTLNELMDLEESP